MWPYTTELPHAWEITASQLSEESTFLTTEPQGSVPIMLPVQPHLDLQRATQSAAPWNFLAQAGPARLLGRDARARNEISKVALAMPEERMC